MSNIDQEIAQLKLALGGAKICASILGLICVNCQKRPSEGYYKPEEGQLCCECLDDLLEEETGCRYSGREGQKNCSHFDCKSSVLSRFKKALGLKNELP